MGGGDKGPAFANHNLSAFEQPSVLGYWLEWRSFRDLQGFHLQLGTKRPTNHGKGYEIPAGINYSTSANPTNHGNAR